MGSNTRSNVRIAVNLNFHSKDISLEEMMSLKILTLCSKQTKMISNLLNYSGCDQLGIILI